MKLAVLLASKKAKGHLGFLFLLLLCLVWERNSLLMSKVLMNLKNLCRRSLFLTLHGMGLRPLPLGPTPMAV